MIWEGVSSDKSGQQPDYNEVAIKTCLKAKMLFGKALRQTTGTFESQLRMTGLDWADPDIGILVRRRMSVQFNIPYCGAHRPSHRLIDSTGIKVESEVKWNACKQGGAERAFGARFKSQSTRRQPKSGLALSPDFGPPGAGFSRPFHGGGLAAPPVLCSALGTL